MMRFVHTLVLTLLCLQLHAESFIDFEKEMLSDFVIDTKKIDIPGFPDAFNPSIVPFHNAFLMSFRTGSFAKYGMSGESGDDIVPEAESFLMSFRFRDRNNPACTIDAVSYKAGTNCKNQIGLVLLNQFFEPISWPQILDLHYTLPMIAERQQDPRLVYVNEKLYIVYSNMINGNQGPEIRRMFVAELSYRDEMFVASDPVALVNYEGKDDQKWTKNWVPFDYDHGLHLAHSINPHVVFRYDGTDTCQTAGKSAQKIAWDYGALRGGTPAILDDDGQYLSFFHSSKDMKTAHSEGKKIQHYFMGAYTFQATPPFALTSISKQPIIGKNFLYGPVYQTWKPLRVVFPGGIVVGKDRVWVAYGRQDHEVWIATIDKKRLKESMVPVQ